MLEKLKARNSSQQDRDVYKGKLSWMLKSTLTDSIAKLYKPHETCAYASVRRFEPLRNIRYAVY